MKYQAVVTKNNLLSVNFCYLCGLRFFWVKF
jgi:hypothetical protein